MKPAHSAETFRKEAKFHDAWAASLKPEAIEVEGVFQHPTAVENRYILRQLGDLRGKRLLDIGCGLGESSVLFAKRGALVTAADISPQMVEFALELARRHGVQLQSAVGPAEHLGFAESSFDIIYTANTIHHLVNKPAFFEKVRLYLKPGGIFCSWDPVRYNPAINVYRRIAADVRTEDENPLGRRDLRLVNAYFSEVQTRHFWLLSLALFGKYFLVDRINPNQTRYWKRIYQEPPRGLWWWRPLEWCDRILLRVPGLRWLSWNIVIIARR
jgi:2-polyprenyl-3-methyl-5-hydroxy-6-metoxy-1,4-benzoquinol methylase